MVTSMPRAMGMRCGVNEMRTGGSDAWRAPALTAAAVRPCSISGMWRWEVTPYGLMPSAICFLKKRCGGTEKGGRRGRGGA